MSEKKVRREADGERAGRVAVLAVVIVAVQVHVCGGEPWGRSLALTGPGLGSVVIAHVSLSTLSLASSLTTGCLTNPEAAQAYTLFASHTQHFSHPQFPFFFPNYQSTFLPSQFSLTCSLLEPCVQDWATSAYLLSAVGNSIYPHTTGPLISSTTV